MKYFMLIMALSINYVSSDGTCVLVNTHVIAFSKCHSSTAVGCNIGNSQLLSTTCLNSHFDGVQITSSIISDTKVSGKGCSVTTCVINGGIVSPTSVCKMTGCTIRAM